ncbi:uncharacterized protein [Lolium perenne]|uniref:uncharacterized protein n=1 Tax=Lolium perenne TaxID=4522 RepID=UPI003A996CC9
MSSNTMAMWSEEWELYPRTVPSSKHGGGRRGLGRQHDGFIRRCTSVTATIREIRRHCCRSPARSCCFRSADHFHDKLLLLLDEQERPWIQPLRGWVCPLPIQRKTEEPWRCKACNCLTMWKSENRLPHERLKFNRD